MYSRLEDSTSILDLESQILRNLWRSSNSIFFLWTVTEKKLSSPGFGTMYLMKEEMLDLSTRYENLERTTYSKTRTIYLDKEWSILDQIYGFDKQKNYSGIQIRKELKMRNKVQKPKLNGNNLIRLEYKVLLKSIR